MVIKLRDKKIRTYIHENASQDVPDVLTRIKEDPRFKTPEKRSIFSSFKVVKLLPYASALIIVFALIFTLNFNQPTPVEASSTVYIEINPSVEIDLDENDNILAIRSNNQAAINLINALGNYEGEKVDVVIERIISKAIEQGYLTSENPFVMYDVAGKNETIRAHVEAILNERIPDIAERNLPDLSFVHGNAKDQTPSEINEARMHNMNIMKYRLINRILETNESLTFDELKSKTIGELREYLTNQDEVPVIPNRPHMPNRSNNE
jgi:hypothetical protein